ncbi:MAG: peptide-methionine (S)-S-oxide reductase MsrA [Candidatus Kaiserbacteria bacterium]|nr:peptide-methionine (S)-S-oxide reductase MsrA [Candidatus Kaiserbacteria bacterium]MCB9816803.1 peptide-methionine (S)-S-oxide reductase MsrA [Candidatus Nomurabacteria bacterium]
MSPTTEVTAVGTTPAATASVAVDSGQRETVVLAGGCFWCTEAFFQEEPGVVDAVNGYAGGTADTADYKTVSRGKTGHREAVQVTFDPVRISFKEILDVYWGHIDPTDDGGQFADRGSQYRTAIFYSNDTERQIAEDSKQRLGTSGLFDKPIVTEILPFTTFFKAEEYHQDYYKKAADHYQRYKRASGRAGFVEETWAKDAALYFLSEEGMDVTDSLETSSTDTTVWTPQTYTAEEIVVLQKALDASAYHIVAENGTEPAFKNAYWDNHEAGIYVDVVTGDPLFSSTNKYDSGTGWPSFYQTITGAPVSELPDTTYGLVRTEVRSGGGHLGHIFNDGPTEHGGKRYCINSGALRFVSQTEMTREGYQDYLYLFTE